MLKNIFLASSAVLASLALLPDSTYAQWSNFRGPESSNVSQAKLLTSMNDSEAIAWSVDLPGRGVSGPIVVDQKVFVTCSTTEKQNELHMFCFDALNGTQLWHRNFWALGRCGSDPTSANAAPTPVSDGTHVIALFSSNDLVCFDLEGNLKWLRALTGDYPNAANDIGMASSPVIYQGTVIVQVENQGDSFVAAIDIKTGKNVWKSARPRKDSWSSPLLVPSSDDRPAQLIVLSAGQLASLDPENGKLNWTIEGPTYPIPSPVFDASSETLFASINGLSAFRLPNADEPETIWSQQRLSPSNISLALMGDKLYTLNRGSVAVCAKIEDGEEVWKARIGGNHYASPLLTPTHGYYFAQDGTARVVDHTLVEPEVTSEFKFESPILGSPAADETGLYVRLQNRLIKFAAIED